MLRIDEVFSTSFDQLLENIFSSSSGSPSIQPNNGTDNIGSYIELYREKKALETNYHQMKKLLRDKTATILSLKQQVREYSSESDTFKQQQLLTARENLNRTRFLAKISHELRTPVNGISGIADLLDDNDLTSEQQSLINLIGKSSQSLSTLINDLLDFSKIEAGALELERIEFVLEEAIKESLDLLMFSAREKQLQLSYQLADGLPTIVRGDPLRLRQILTNLAGNAIKFTENGEVHILAEPAGFSEEELTVRFKVRDTGIGITKLQQKSLFKHYSQVDASITRKFGGTGLGLAISKELTKLMGGQIGIESTKGVGSTFWFTAHFLKSTTAEIRPGQDAFVNIHLPEVGRKKLNILLVEDDEITRKVSTLLLKRSGQERIDLAENGLQAIEKLRKSTYDIVLMDMQMPEMDGLEATRRIRQPNSGVLTPQVPIIAMTANSLDADRDECLSAGMNAFLSKPLDAGELSRTIQHFSKIDDQLIERHDELPTIDTEQLGQIQKDMEDRYEPLLQLFIKSLPDKIADIRSAITTDSPADLTASAHKLRGNCASFYARKMAAHCQDLEDSAQHDMQNVPELFTLLEKEASKVIDFFNSESPIT
jgi:signal transduction histidine kinase/DNA-binding NarL/FixJ family response regulator